MHLVDQVAGPCHDEADRVAGGELCGLLDGVEGQQGPLLFCDAGAVDDDHLVRGEAEQLAQAASLGGGERTEVGGRDAQVGAGDLGFIGTTLDHEALHVVGADEGAVEEVLVDEGEGREPAAAPRHVLVVDVVEEGDPWGRGTQSREDVVEELAVGEEDGGDLTAVDEVEDETWGIDHAQECREDEYVVCELGEVGAKEVALRRAVYGGEDGDAVALLV